MANDIEQNMLRERAKKLEEVSQEQWLQVEEFNREKVEEFLMESTQLSDKSLIQYRSALKIFYYWVHTSLKDKKIFEIKKKDFMRFQNMLVRRGMSSSGIKLKRSSVSSMNKYLINFYEDDEDFATFRNFVEGVPNPVLSKTYEKVVLTKDEIDLICKSLEESKQYQELAAFYMLYMAGCRRSELIQVRKSIMEHEYVKDPKTGEVKNYYMTHNIRGKGKGELGEQYPLLFDDNVKRYLKMWLDERGEDDCEYIFVSKRKDSVSQINPSAVNYWFAEIISDIVGRRINPHITRSSRSTHILESGLDIKKAQKLLRHKDSSTTEKFYDLRQDKDDMADVF